MVKFLQDEIDQRKYLELNGHLRIGCEMSGNSKKYHSLVVDNTGENKVKSLRDQKKKEK